MATPAVAPIVRLAGKGRQPAAVEEARDLRLELAARHAEAVALVDGLAPMVSALISGCRELGPRHYQLALTVRDRLDRFRRQQDPDPETPAVAA